ncbi:MAG TPA: oligosaccharide flippase family protein [Polyangiales bacterium]|nr:oligosaccharide flippase family protein [Polyangiales bacterium]
MPQSPLPTPNSFHRELQRAWRATRHMGVSLLCTWTVALLVRFAVPRHLGPLAFGELSFVETFAGGFFVFATLGVETYAMREAATRPQHTSDYFAGVNIARVLVSTLLMAAMLGVLVLRGKSPTLLAAAAICGLTNFTASLNSLLGTLLQATSSTSRLAASNVIAKIAWGLALMIALWEGHVELLWLFALPALFSEAFKTWLLYPGARDAVGLKWRIDLAATRAVLRTSFPFYLGTIAIALGGPLNFMALELLKSDSHELGWYGATLNLAGLALIFSPILQWVQLPLLSRARARGAGQVDAILAYSLEALLLISIPLVLIGALGGEYFVLLALGPAYVPGTLAFQVLIVMFVFTYAAMILANGLITHGRGWSLSTISIANVLAAPLLSMALVPLVRDWMGEGGDAAGAAIALSTTEVLVVGLAVARIGRGILTPRLGRALFKSLAICAIVVFFDRMLPRAPLVRLPLDLLVYGMLAIGLRALDVRELRRLVRSVRAARIEPS